MVCFCLRWVQKKFKDLRSGKAVQWLSLEKLFVKPYGKSTPEHPHERVISIDFHHSSFETVLSDGCSPKNSLHLYERYFQITLSRRFFAQDIRWFNILWRYEISYKTHAKFQRTRNQIYSFEIIFFN